MSYRVLVCLVGPAGIAVIVNTACIVGKVNPTRLQNDIGAVSGGIGRFRAVSGANGAAAWMRQGGYLSRAYHVLGVM
jgi:hypothetical protein